MSTKTDRHCPQSQTANMVKKYVKIEIFRRCVLASREFPLVDLGNNPDFNQVIKANQIQTIHSGETTLEDIFIRVTGVNLDDE